MEGKTCAEVDSCSTAAEVIAECSAHPQQNRSRLNRLRRAGKGDHHTIPLIFAHPLPIPFHSNYNITLA